MGGPSDSDDPAKAAGFKAPGQEPVTQEDILAGQREIARELERTSRWSEDERKNIVRTLLRTYHPDKHPNTILATELTKFLNEQKWFYLRWAGGFRTPLHYENHRIDPVEKHTGAK